MYGGQRTQSEAHMATSDANVLVPREQFPRNAAPICTYCIEGKDRKASYSYTQRSETRRERSIDTGHDGSVDIHMYVSIESMAAEFGGLVTAKKRTSFHYPGELFLLDKFSRVIK